MLKTICLILACVLVPAMASAQSCGQDRLTQKHTTLVPGKGVNVKLLDSAVRFYINHERCKRGLKPLSRQSKLFKVTGNHARWMARNQVISHNSRVRGQRKLATRLKASGADYRVGGENLVATHRFQIEGGRRFLTKSAKQCVFVANSQQISPHSYKSLANHAVRLWMASKGHRKNILSPRFRALATSVAFDARSANCGKFYISQNFIG